MRQIDIIRKNSNNIVVVGKVLKAEFSNGKNATSGVAWQSASLTVRVNQSYSGITETSEIIVRAMASQYTSNGSPSPAWDSINKMKALKTAENVGIDEADVIKFTKAELRESAYVNKTTGQMVNGWEVRANFFTLGGAVEDCATFQQDIYILDMKDEIGTDNEPTGRLEIRAGIVQFGGKLDIVKMYVEDADKIANIQQSWNINDTVIVRGRVRVTTKEVTNNTFSEDNMWGEDMPVIASTSTVRELIVTGGSATPFEEEMAFDQTDIRKAFNERKAIMDQKLIDAQSKATVKSRSAMPTWTME